MDVITKIDFEAQGFGSKEFGNPNPKVFDKREDAIAYLLASGYVAIDATVTGPTKFAKLSRSARAVEGHFLYELFVATVTSDHVVWVVLYPDGSPAKSVDGTIAVYSSGDDARAAAGCIEEVGKGVEGYEHYYAGMHTALWLMSKVVAESNK